MFLHVSVILFTGEGVCVTKGGDQGGVTGRCNQRRCYQRGVCPGGVTRSVCDLWVVTSLGQRTTPQDRGPHPPPPAQRTTPLPSRYRQHRNISNVPVGTHPTGMHSCFNCCSEHHFWSSSRSMK